MSSNAVAYTRMVGARSGSGRASHRVFLSIVAVLFTGAVALTVQWCESMSAMGGMPMPGGWSMSMSWMRMPGETWAGATTSFMTMWTVMMVAMMLPSFTSTLWKYQQGLADAGMRPHWPAVIFGLGYFFVWSAIGFAIFPLAVFLADCEMRLPAMARDVPIAAGMVVLLAGALQFTAWKAHHLACCRGIVRPVPGAVSALQSGLRLGLHCCCGCTGMTAILLVVGMMDLRGMATVTAAITVERLAPERYRVVRMIGFIIIAWGLYMMVRAV